MWKRASRRSLGLRQAGAGGGLGEPRGGGRDMGLVDAAGLRDHRREMGRDRRRRLGERIAVGLAGLVPPARLLEQAGLEQQRHEAERIDPERAATGGERRRQIALRAAHGGELEPGLAAVRIGGGRPFEQARAPRRRRRARRRGPPRPRAPAASPL